MAHAPSAAFAAARAIHDRASREGNRMLTSFEQREFDTHMATHARQTGAVVGHDNALDRPFTSVGEFLGGVRDFTLNHGKTSDPRIQAAAALGQNETIDSQGGMLVPVTVSDKLLQKTFDTGMITSRCDTTPMGTPTLSIPRVDENSRRDGQRQGGIRVYREAEAGQYTTSRSKLDALTLTANKLIGATYLTDELQEDANAAALDKWIFQAFPNEFSFRMDLECWQGTGAGEFLGVNTSPVPVVVGKDNGQAPGTVTTTNIENMWTRLWAPSRKNAAWFINQDVEGQLLQLTRGSGTAVELFYVLPGFKGNNTPYATMFGRPVIPIEQASTVGTQGDVMLADWNEGYLIGTRGAMKQQSSIHVAFFTDQTAFKWSVRNDGAPKWKQPLLPYNSNNTQSPFVVLQSRI